MMEAYDYNNFCRTFQEIKRSTEPPLASTDHLASTPDCPPEGVSKKQPLRSLPASWYFFEVW